MLRFQMLKVIYGQSVFSSADCFPPSSSSLSLHILVEPLENEWTCAAFAAVADVKLFAA